MYLANNLFANFFSAVSNGRTDSNSESDWKY